MQHRDSSLARALERPVEAGAGLRVESLHAVLVEKAAALAQRQRARRRVRQRRPVREHQIARRPLHRVPAQQLARRRVPARLRQIRLRGGRNGGLLLLVGGIELQLHLHHPLRIQRDDGRRRLAVHQHRAHVRAVAVEVHVERHAANAQTRQPVTARERLRHARRENEILSLVLQAEQTVVEQAQHPRHAPELAVGILNRLPGLAGLRVQILLVRAERHRRANHERHRTGRAGRVLLIRVRQQHERLDERPHRAIVVRARNRRLVRREHRRPVRRNRQIAQRLRRVLARHARMHRQRRRQRVAALVEAAVRRAEHPVAARRPAPERLADRLGELGRGLRVASRLVLAPQQRKHPRQHLVRRAMQHVRPERVRRPDIRRRHPIRVALLPPVDKRSLSRTQPVVETQRLLVLRQRRRQHVGAPRQPVAVAVGKVERPRAQRPGHAIRRHRPAAARPRILQNHPVAHARHQTLAAGLRRRERRPEHRRVGEIARPHARPRRPGEQKPLRRHVRLQLGRREAEHRRQHGDRTRETRRPSRGSGNRHLAGPVPARDAQSLARVDHLRRQARLFQPARRQAERLVLVQHCLRSRSHREKRKGIREWLRACSRRRRGSAPPARGTSRGRRPPAAPPCPCRRRWRRRSPAAPRG